MSKHPPAFSFLFFLCHPCSGRSLSWPLSTKQILPLPGSHSVFLLFHHHCSGIQTTELLHLINAPMAPLNHPRYSPITNPPSYLECPFHKYDSIKFHSCANRPFSTLSDWLEHLRSEHRAAHADQVPWTCPICRKEINEDRLNTQHNHPQCVKTRAGESGILLNFEMAKCLGNTKGQSPETVWYKV